MYILIHCKRKERMYHQYEISLELEKLHIFIVTENLHSNKELIKGKKNITREKKC